MAIEVTVDEVAAVVPTRTKAVRANEDADPPYVKGQEIGTFNDDTKPTGEQVELLIVQAITDVTNRVGTVPEAKEAGGKSPAVIRAAMYVELRYFPEQINDGQSPYERLRELWLDEIEQYTDGFADSEVRPSLVSVPIRSPHGIWPEEEVEDEE